MLEICVAYTSVAAGGSWVFRLPLRAMDLLQDAEGSSEVLQLRREAAQLRSQLAEVKRVDDQELEKLWRLAGVLLQPMIYISGIPWTQHMDAQQL